MYRKVRNYWFSSEVRKRPTFLETLITKSDSGPVKLPGRETAPRAFVFREPLCKVGPVDAVLRSVFVDNDRDSEGEPEKIISEVKNITKASLNVEHVYSYHQ